METSNIKPKRIRTEYYNKYNIIRKTRRITCEHCNKSYDNSNWCKHINTKKHKRNSSSDINEVINFVNNITPNLL